MRITALTASATGTTAGTYKPRMNSVGVDLNKISAPGVKFKTRGLFVEMNPNEDTDPAPYSLTDNVPGKVSAHALYLNCADVTDYAFAMELVGSWDHWEVLRETPWFKVLLTKWRDELEARVRSMNVARMLNNANQGDSQAIKWAASKGWVMNEATKGRPTKESKDSAAKEVAKAEREIESALERMGLKNNE